MALALLEHFSSSLKEGPKGGTKPKGGTGLNLKPFLLSSAMASVAKSKGAGVDASPKSPSIVYPLPSQQAIGSRLVHLEAGCEQLVCKTSREH